MTRTPPVDALTSFERHDPRRPWNLTILRALNPDGSLLWPDYWQLESLLDLYWSGGSASFGATFMQDPSGLAGAVFNADDFQYFAPAGYVDENGVGVDELIRQGIVQRVLPTDEKLACTMGIDLSVATKEIADYYARVHLLASRSGDVYVIDVVQDRKPMGKILEDIAFAREKNHARAIGVGEDLMEKTLTSLFRTVAAPGGPRYGQLPWIPVPTRGLDKATRARPFALKYEHHRVFHLYGARWLTMWESQLAAFPGSAHDDMVDAGVCSNYVLSEFDPRDAASLIDLAKDLSNPRSLPGDDVPGRGFGKWPTDDLKGGWS